MNTRPQSRTRVEVPGSEAEMLRTSCAVDVLEFPTFLTYQNGDGAWQVEEQAAAIRVQRVSGTLAFYEEKADESPVPTTATYTITLQAFERAVSSLKNGKDEEISGAKYEVVSLLPAKVRVALPCGEARLVELAVLETVLQVLDDDTTIHDEEDFGGR